MKVLLQLTFVLLLVQPLSGQKGDWHIFRGDPALKGVSQSLLPAKPKLLWSYFAGDDMRSAPVSSGTRIVSGSMNGTLYCLDMDGNLKWKFLTGNGIEAPALINKGLVYVGNLDGSLLCLDLETGIVQWSFQADGQISGSPNIWEDQGRTLLVFGSYDFFLYGLDADSGDLVWKYETDNFINGTPAVYKGTAIFGGCDGYLHQVDLRTGELKQKIDVATYVASSAAVDRNLAFVGDHDGRFSCVDLESGMIKWTWEDELVHLPFLASPAVSSERVIIGCEDKNIYCFDRSSGGLKWKFNTGSRVIASVVVAPNGVLTANMRGDLNILDIRDGSVLWTYELGSAVSGNPSVMEGKFFVTASDGYLYCFGK